MVSLSSVKEVVTGLLVGAGATTTAEYLFKYNLLDLIIEKVKGLFSKGETAAKAEVKKL